MGVGVGGGWGWGGGGTRTRYTQTRTRTRTPTHLRTKPPGRGAGIGPYSGLIQKGMGAQNTQPMGCASHTHTHPRRQHALTHPHTPKHTRTHTHTHRHIHTLPAALLAATGQQCGDWPIQWFDSIGNGCPEYTAIGVCKSLTQTPIPTRNTRSRTHTRTLTHSLSHTHTLTHTYVRFQRPYSQPPGSSVGTGPYSGLIQKGMGAPNTQPMECARHTNTRTTHPHTRTRTHAHTRTHTRTITPKPAPRVQTDRITRLEYMTMISKTY